MTHYVDYDVQVPRKTIVQALCGEYVRRDEGVGAPTCPKCQRLLKIREDEDAETARKLGVIDDHS